MHGSIHSHIRRIGTAGGDGQQNDIRMLRKELEMKKARLNELAEEIRRKEKLAARMKDDNVDAARLTPEQLEDEVAYIQQLKDEMRRIDEDLTEAEAKNRLYYLLGERTRCVCVHARVCVRPSPPVGFFRMHGEGMSAWGALGHKSACMHAWAGNRNSPYLKWKGICMS